MQEQDNINNRRKRPKDHVKSAVSARRIPTYKLTEKRGYALKSKTGKDGPKWTDITVALFTLFLFLAAVIQGCIFYKQWEEMHSGGTDTHDLALSADSQARAARTQADEAREQVEKMSEALAKTDALIKESTEQATATEKLSEQAQRSADYAKQSIDAAVDAERPWVGVTSYTENNFYEGKTAGITIRYSNTGKRPASVTMTYGGGTLDKLPLFPDMIRNPSASVGFMLPGQSQQGTFEVEIPDGAFSTWRAKHQTFYILAQIVYTDVETNKSYITDFCAYYTSTDKYMPFVLCPRLNEAK